MIGPTRSCGFRGACGSARQASASNGACFDVCVPQPIRVSTERQLDGYGLDVQEKNVRRWCREASHRLGRTIYRDEGHSGALESPDRPGMADALTEVEDGIIAPALDRFARTLVVQEAILAQIWKHGGRATP
ncbi:recombinase family protein (plasmid) [Streptomyces sp. NBC_01007]|nr:recombinase family protein [Streptomyces sp. NBC_01007]